MTKKRLDERRKRNQELAAMDAANRCVICKLDLALARQIIEDLIVPGKCCSDACLEALLARDRGGQR